MHIQDTPPTAPVTSVLDLTQAQPAKIQGSEHTTAPVSLPGLEPLLKDLQTLQEERHNHHHQAQKVVHGLRQSFTQHLQTLHRLWDWGEDYDIGDLPSFADWLETPVEPTLTSWPTSDILSGVNALDTQILIQHGWQKKESPPSSDIVANLQDQTAESYAESLNTTRYSNKQATASIESKETVFQTLLQDLLEQVDQCRELLAQLDLIQTRSHQTEQTQEHHLQSAEDLLTASHLKSLDCLFQDLQESWHQKTKSANIPFTLIVPNQDTHIWIEAQPYETLLQGVSGLLDAWLAQNQNIESSVVPLSSSEKDISSPDSSLASLNPSLSSTLTLAPHIQGKSLMIAWQEIMPSQHTTVMNRSYIENVWDGIDTPWSVKIAQPSSSAAPHHPKDNVESLNADGSTIEASRPMNVRHTHAILQMPLAPARCKQLVCRVNDDLYGLSIEQIEQLILPKTDQLKMATGGVLMLKWQLNQQEKLLRVYPLSQLLQYSHSAAWIRCRHRQDVESASDPSTPPSQHPMASSPPPSAVSLTAPAPILLLHISQQWVGIMVNEVVDEKMVLLRPLSNAIAAPPWIQGCSLVHEHQFALSIDLKLLLRQAVGFGL